MNTGFYLNLLSLWRTFGSELLAFNRPRVRRTGFELRNTRLGPRSPTKPRHAKHQKCGALSKHEYKDAQG